MPKRFPKAPYHHAALILKRVKGKGLGVFTTAPLRQGELITVSRGQKVSEKRRNVLDTKDFCYQIGRFWHYCPSPYSKPDLSWYMNHSCEPNVLPTGPRSRIMLAKRDIRKGEEISYDYVITESDPTYAFVCTCGSKNCRKKFTGNDWKIPTLQKRYKGIFEPYLQKKIDKLALAKK